VDLNTIEAVVSPSTRTELPEWTQGDGFLAGGTWLFSEPQPRLRRLVDLAGLAWPALRIGEDGLEIAATCRIAELASCTAPGAWRAASLIPLCCNALLGSFKVWNMATVGGNLCLGLPAGPMTALAAALDGVCTIWTADDGERRVRAVDFVVGNQCTVLEAGEILRAIALPAGSLRRRAAFRQISLSPEGRSAALLIGTRHLEGGLALTITAATPRPVRLEFAALPSAAELLQAIEVEVTAKALWFDDVHGAPDWRRHVSLRLADEIVRELATEGELRTGGSCA
jgi:CO/xanthine dehydrogenase FAD-binding subunit